MIASIEYVLEQKALITKLPAGGWRVWSKTDDLRVYGPTREAALLEAATRILQRGSFGKLSAAQLR